MKRFTVFRIDAFLVSSLLLVCVVSLFEHAFDKIGTAREDTDSNVVHVFVSGAVENPGLVTAEKGITLFEASSTCGFCENAYIEDFLKTETAKDGDEVYIMTSSEHEALVLSPKININTASPAELEALPQIGAALAQRIVDYRTQNGTFNTEKELMLVPGIFESKYNTLQLFITVKQED